MIPLSLGAIAELTGARLVGAAPGQEADPATLVTGPVIIDSRAAAPGALFAALPGTRVDGHEFAAQAVAAGAAAVLATRPCGAPALIVPDVTQALGRLARAVVDALPSLQIAGITGSAGKTTTKDLAAQLVEALGPTVAPRASWNNEIGHPLTVLRATADTRYLVLELSARGPGHIAHLCQIAPPRLGVVLCVGHAHEGEFGGIEEVARAKGELPAALPEDGVALLNADDPRVMAMAARTAARVVTFGRGPADVRAEDVRLDDRGRPGFRLVSPAGSGPVQLRLYGGHNVSNALAAAALAGELGLPVAGDRAAAVRGRGPQPLADGGHRAPGRRHRAQRCLQRQPRGRPVRPGHAGRAGPRAPLVRGARADERAGRALPDPARGDRRVRGPGRPDRPYRGRRGGGPHPDRGQGRAVLGR